MPDAEPHPVQSLDPDTARRLMEHGQIRILDVRSYEEYRNLGHLAGALLLPVELIASGPAVLPRDDRPLLVVCQHGVRSAHAAHLLARAGFREIFDLAGGISAWDGTLDHTPPGPGALLGPSSWLTACAPYFSAGGRVLDIACGRGRHALLLAAAGCTVLALDNNKAKLDELKHTARRLDLTLETRLADLEHPGVKLGEGEFDLLVGIHYLHRPLFPTLIRALKPGGLLLYETFLKAQAARGGPRNPAFLLEPGELKRLVAPLRILQEREGLYEDRAVASVLASSPTRRPGPATPDEESRTN